MDKSQVEADVSIDKFALDDEWVKHPSNVLSYSEQAVEAERVVSRLELRKDVLIAQLDQQLRETATERVTEAVLKNFIARQPEFQELEEEIILAKYELNMLRAVVRALEHKRKGLEKLVDLHLTSYFSEPRSTVGADLVQEQVSKKLKEALGEKRPSRSAVPAQ